MPCPAVLFTRAPVSASACSAAAVVVFEGSASEGEAGGCGGAPEVRKHKTRVRQSVLLWSQAVVVVLLR